MDEKIDLFVREKYLEEQIEKSANMIDFLDDHKDLDSDKSLLNEMNKIYKDSIHEYKKVVKDLYMNQEYQKLEEE